jgi:mitogen-activated protein kinase kinase
MSSDRSDEAERSRSAMSSPAPLLRPPIAGAGRTGGGLRTPRLGLSIPLSPSQKAVAGGGGVPDLPPLQQPQQQQQQRPSSARPAPPQLRLATPQGRSAAPLDHRALAQPSGASASDTSARSRSDSFGIPDGRGSGPSSASSASHSAVSSGNRLGQPGGCTPDPSSAISSGYEPERDGGGGGQAVADLEKLSQSLGRALDVDDLDDDGWMMASKGGRIEELGTLGEGAGGAVTKCRLRGGKTVFALKVGRGGGGSRIRAVADRSQIITTDPDPDVQKQIRRELDFNRKIAADHICKYYGAYGDSSSGIISIAMEYCEGGSLDSIYREVKARNGRMAEKVLGKIADGVLEGLTYLYSCKIIHRGRSGPHPPLRTG